jgi:hypothetical protein
MRSFFVFLKAKYLMQVKNLSTLNPTFSVEMEVHTKKCGYPLISGLVHFGAHLDEGVSLHLGTKCDEERAKNHTHKLEKKCGNP